MRSLLVLIIIFAILFLLVYLTRRRFGVLALALCAGQLLSDGWTEVLTPIVRQQGITLIAPPLTAIVAVFLLLFPAVLLIFAGSTSSKGLVRLGSAFGFAILALTMMLGPLAEALVLDGPGQQLYLGLTNYGRYIIVAGILLALIDVILTRSAGQVKKDK